MIKLGHIIYSNCLPMHAGIITGVVPFPFTLVDGIPTALNRLLLDGGIDISPSSSIEYAYNPGRYRILPGFSITSRSAAKSIILQSSVPLNELDRGTVALTTASATSVVLLRILLELRSGLSPDYIDFEQGKEEPPARVHAALTIGDHALKLEPSPRFPHLYDLGALWNEFTGLPFVFALWQVNYKKTIDKDLVLLYDVLQRSKEYGLSHLEGLARDYSARFGIPAERLLDYWRSFSFDLSEKEQKGLLTYYAYAAELGMIESVPDLRFWQAP